MRDKTREILSRYGYHILLILLDHYEYTENFEICKAIKEELSELEELLNIKIDKLVKKDFIDDYKQGFWELGLSGDNALNNLPYYIGHAFEIMEK